MVLILCEGATCNNGRDPIAHERKLLDAIRVQGEARADASKRARALVTAEMHYTRHEVHGHLARCTECGHTRVYG